MGSLRMDVPGSTRPGSGIQEPTALTLDQSGMIQDCSDNSEELFGFAPGELIRNHISRLLPQLSEIALLSDGRLNSRLIYLTHCGYLFKAMRRDGGVLSSELFFSQLEYGVNPILRLIIRPSGDASTIP